MKYYLLLEGDTEADTIHDCNILGEVSFNKFIPNDGFDVLKNIVNSGVLELSSIRIINSKGTNLTVAQFLTQIEKYK
jgi:hypothetical protein